MLKSWKIISLKKLYCCVFTFVRADMFEVISKQGFLKRLRHFIDGLRDTSELLKNAMFTKRNELT